MVSALLLPASSLLKVQRLEQRPSAIQQVHQAPFVFEGPSQFQPDVFQSLSSRLQLLGGVGAMRSHRVQR